MITLGDFGLQETGVKALDRILIPRNVSRLRALMELANYYSKFVEGFTLLAKPFMLLTQINQEWVRGSR